MRTFIAYHETISASEFIELAVGIVPELWLGEDDESPEERAARLDAARDILTDDPELFDRVTHLVPELITSPALPKVVSLHRRIQRAEVAAA
ncbi:hypothetical protein ACFOSC_18095 [Streptantibioticus rubrisoli]|uniref:Uncharacterized protein n=1 Tax=Streptantibioticus rubrisoli TaxID=1387313 RepID=A0ABT1PH27_9ACTN|nr:hypothetical protein [Streptantibioticus rubrisoli]MCQ4044654.1 hypothetical protein [Streptantibioticus rubrisoli]